MVETQSGVRWTSATPDALRPVYSSCVARGDTILWGSFPTANHAASLGVGEEYSLRVSDEVVVQTAICA